MRPEPGSVTLEIRGQCREERPCAGKPSWSCAPTAAAPTRLAAPCGPGAQGGGPGGPGGTRVQRLLDRRPLRGRRGCPPRHGRGLLSGEGLVTPALHHADALALPWLMSAPKDLVTPARTGGLRGPEVSRATITVTDLGDQDVETVLGVTHPSQVPLLLAPDDVFRRVLGTDSLVFLSCVEVLSERSVVHIEDEDVPRLTTLSGSADFLVAARGEGRGPGDPVRPARPERRPAGPWLRRRRAPEPAVP